MKISDHPYHLMFLGICIHRSSLLNLPLIESGLWMVLCSKFRSHERGHVENPETFPLCRPALWPRFISSYRHILVNASVDCGLWTLLDTEPNQWSCSVSAIAMGLEKRWSGSAQGREMCCTACGPVLPLRRIMIMPVLSICSKYDT